MAKTKTSSEEMINKFKMKQDNVNTNFDFDLNGLDSKNKSIKKVLLNQLIDAPENWNFYTPLLDEKLYELVESIYDNGLISPVVLWEQKNDQYMILAGHNRVRAYRILSEYQEQYNMIPSIIHKADELDNDSALAIIIDSNWVTRELNAVEKAKSVFYKLQIVGRKEYTGDSKLTRDKVAKEFNMTGRNLSKLNSINKCINPFIEDLEKGKISIDAAERLSMFTPLKQQWIYDNFNKRLSKRKVLLLNKDMNDDEISNVFYNDMSAINLKVPKEQHKEIKLLLRKWIEENNFDIVM